MEARKVSNRLVTTFSITSSPIIYRTKALASVTILTSKLLATNRALIDYKKRRRLHFCNNNFENNFSFPDVFCQQCCNGLSFQFIPPDTTFQILQSYVISEDQKYWPLCRPWRKSFKTAHVLYFFSSFHDF